MTRALVVGDFHLGDPARRDVLRRAGAVRALCERLDDVDRLVLLGDVLELRHGSLRARLDDAEPVLRRLAAAMRGRAVTLLLGNHDHALVDGFLSRRRLAECAPAPLALDELVPLDSSPMTRHVAAWFEGTHLEIRYPGAWLAPRIYTTHGHYMDVHMRTPTLERVAAGLLGRLQPPFPPRATTADYEARLGPTLSLYFEAGQSINGDRPGLPGVERRLFGLLARLPSLGTRARLTTDVSGPAQVRDAVDGLREAIRRLAIPADDLIFGHVHHSGPWPRRRDTGWHASAPRLWNPGSWLQDDGAIDAGDPNCPWRPGAAIRLEDGRLELERVL